MELLCMYSPLAGEIIFFREKWGMTANGLQLQEVGDFGEQNCLPPLNLIRSTIPIAIGII